MTNQALLISKEAVKNTFHRAFYKAVSEQRWSLYQKRAFKFWKSEQALKSRQVFTRRYYLPLFEPLALDLKDDISMLEIGPGPVCAAQYLGKGHATYIDPLMDDYRRLFPGTLPEKSAYLATAAEKCKLDKTAFDIILCLNTLSGVHNPELVLNVVKTSLKADGHFVVSIDLWPSLLARAHYFLSRFVPVLPEFNRLYSYTHHGFSNTLLRHFDIESEQLVKPQLYWASFKQEMLFVCKHKADKA